MTNIAIEKVDSYDKNLIKETLLEMIEKAGLKLGKKHENVGVHDYTLLEVVHK